MNIKMDNINIKMDNINIILIGGLSGSGKDYAASLFKNNSKNSIILSLSKHMKLDLISKYNYKYDEIFDIKNKKTRNIMQIVGTDLERKRQPDYFIKILENEMMYFYKQGFRIFIIPDIRFYNELEYFTKNYKNCIKIYINSDKSKKNILSHSSENINLSKYFDILIENDYTTNFDKKIINMI